MQNDTVIYIQEQADARRKKRLEEERKEEEAELKRLKIFVKSLNKRRMTQQEAVHISSSLEEAGMQLEHMVNLVKMAEVTDNGRPIMHQFRDMMSRQTHNIVWGERDKSTIAAIQRAILLHIILKKWYEVYNDTE